ncbi:MAG: oxidoreductase [Ferruginibacter sp.]
MLYKLSLVICIIIMVTGFAGLTAQTIQLVSSGTKTSIRGLSVVDDRVIWVSGSNGTVGKSVDSGNTFKWITVKGFEKSDFRDIEAFDDRSAVIMAIAEPAYILRTTNGGETWETAYENKTKGMFLDAMEFRSRDSGIVIGDPINGNFFVAGTFDGGASWQDISSTLKPAPDSGEACFASSGTNIRSINPGYALVSGGLNSSLFISGEKMPIPFTRSKETAGGNSLAVKTNLVMVVVGGNFATKDSIAKNCFVTKNGGRSWTAPSLSPHGYRSCVEWLDKNNWISCGLNGVDYSKDEGDNWNWISKESFHVCRKAKKGKAVFFAGNDGRIGKLSGY